MALTCDDVQTGDCFDDIGARGRSLGVRLWPPASFAYDGDAPGRRLLRERSAAWSIARPRTSEQPNTGEPAHDAAALELALQMIANRWKPSIVLHLAAGPQRRRDLEQRLPRHVSAKVLTEQLRALEVDGLVYRVDCTPAGHGRHVTYALTELGQTLGPVITALTAWAVEHRTDLLRRGGSVFVNRER